MGKKSGTSYHEFTSGQETIHLVQPYRMVKKRGLTPVDALRVDSPTAARERAKRLFETGRYAGLDAVTVTGDPELGEYDEPVFHVRLGQVPDSEGDEP